MNYKVTFYQVVVVTFVATYGSFFTNVLQFCGEVQGNLRLTSYHTFQKTAPLTLWLAVHAPGPLFCMFL